MWYNVLYKYIKMALTSSENKSSKNVHKIISVKTLNFSLQKLMIFLLNWFASTIRQSRLSVCAKRCYAFLSLGF